MDLGSHILSLLEPVRLGDEVLPGARLLEVSTELGPTLSFDVLGCRVQIYLEPFDPQRPSAARSARLMFSYRTNGGTLDPQIGLALCVRLAELTRAREQVVLDSVAEQASRELGRQETAPSKIREVTVAQLLQRADSAGHRIYTLSPYVGCLIGCRFCYAQSRVVVSRRLERLEQVPWGSYVDVRINAPEVLARELEAHPVAALKFCPIVSDPYQAVERRYELTRRCLEVIGASRKSWPVLVLTRSALIERDLELIASVPGCHVGVSLPTIDDGVRRHFEPRASSISERLRVLATFRERGVRTFAVVQPQLPGDVEALVDALAERVESVSIDVLHGEEGASADFDDAAYVQARTTDWQLRRARRLAQGLRERDVTVWSGELPPWLT